MTDVEKKINNILEKINKTTYPKTYIDKSNFMTKRERIEYPDVNFKFIIGEIGNQGIFADIYIFDYIKEIKLEYSYVLERYPEKLKTAHFYIKELKKECFPEYKTTFRSIDDRYFPRPPSYEKNGIIQ